MADIFDKQITDYKTQITEYDRIVFKELESFLGKYNDEQKKAIISGAKKILCVAGAGSGKTTVLTKRIEFLVKYKEVNPSKILAITFTRKARKEMMRRLHSLGISVKVETFNSFCEKILKTYERQIYGKPTRMLSYTSKALMVTNALSNLGMNLNEVIDIYFTESQRENAEFEKLSNSFLNDCFYVLDYFKMKNQPLYDFSKEIEDEKEAAKIVYGICDYIQKYMEMAGLRDFTDQLVDTLRFFKKNEKAIPQYQHVLVDEYQDVNQTQTELLHLLNPENLFCVGDPRQSIYGWRGSDIKYILDFKEKYNEAEIISLVKNYRSEKQIVQLINKAIKNMNMPDLIGNKEGGKILLKKFQSEEEEHTYVINEILKTQTKKEDIFVLARTNRQLNFLSKKMAEKGIPHTVKTDEVKYLTPDNGVTLATVHAIKGLEAQKVFVIGTSDRNFPCKATDHPAISFLKTDYDKDEEERRLLYVALSRAKSELIVSYYGKKISSFINKEMLKLMEQEQKELFSFSG